jgi:sec-independent protein translocase protein TatC
MKTPENPEDFQMGLMDHLRELRKRLIISIVVVGLGALFAYVYASDLFDILYAPFYAAFASAPLIGTAPAEAWTLKLKVSVFAGAIITSPILFYQLWQFVAPGLYAHERKLVVPFVLVSTLLFCTGVVFCYYAVLPFTFAFFKGEYESIKVTPTIKVGEHLSMTVTALLGFGGVFELPVLTFFLARAGIIDHRFLIEWFRHAVVVIFIVAAVLTPPDVLTQFLMAGPLLLLYGISIAIAWWASPPANTASTDLGVVRKDE